jgi:hypothetical protein
MFKKNVEYKRNKILIVYGDVKKVFQNDLLGHLIVYTYLFIYLLMLVKIWIQIHYGPNFYYEC